MPTPDPPSLLELLPTELLERIFLFASPRDILRLSLVNRTSHALVQASPSIQYEVDLFAAGLKRNPRIEPSLVADSRAALAAYRGRWGALEPVEKRDRTIRGDSWGPIDASVVSGVCGLLWKDRVRFIILESMSRGIPGREWDVSLKGLEAGAFTFYPGANVMAVAEEGAWKWRIQLSTLNGKPHPAAQTPVLTYTFVPEAGSHPSILDMSIAGSRLAIFSGSFNKPAGRLVVWDWITGQILLELENMNYQSARLIDDDWVILLLDASREPAAPPRLVLLNTKQTTTNDKTFAQTTFNFDPHEHTDLGVVGLHFELGGYEPSLEEGLLAPFYPDTSQRVLTVEFATSGDLFVMRVETLLRLARARGGGDLQWEEWQAHVVRVQYRGTRIYNLWVSGARLFCIYSAELEFRKAVLDMYDFSAQASGKYTEATKGGTVQRAARPSITHNLPWIAPTIGFASSGHDSIAILVDSEYRGDPLECTFHVWNF